MNKNILAIIPARAGSKGVKNKNSRKIAGKPLISWTILEAMKSKYLTNTIVSTDCNKISSIADNLGVEVLNRPKDLATDTSPVIPTLKHASAYAEEKYNTYNAVLLLQPTAPMRTCKDIDQSIEIFFKRKDAESLISVYKVEDSHPSRMYTILQNNSLEKFYEEPEGSLRQDLKEIYHRNGAIYICSRNLLMLDNKLISDDPIPYIMPKERSVNIDDEQDFITAGFLMENFK